jgi:succinate dehydrogenase flavin-adding protein (antitoxin of CptAB toxin-antitoxin module)
MKELDALFETYFNSSDLSHCDDASITALERLMDCQDTDLLDWLLGHSMPQDAQLQQVVQHIRETRIGMQGSA